MIASRNRSVAYAEDGMRLGRRQRMIGLTFAKVRVIVKVEGHLHWVVVMHIEKAEQLAHKCSLYFLDATDDFAVSRPVYYEQRT